MSRESGNRHESRHLSNKANARMMKLKNEDYEKLIMNEKRLDRYDILAENRLH
jgi:hypothetical protein